ncbi:uncharacterized protein J4E92_008951 [Alternaria infectoria]|uniref:uncharacterized protein n=1 Tax=Alternaria infectoria TaxID=45303 RepID=UPI00221F99F8|nr:uncharacterized protein J4E92_008951 [Alternaria infectoria]KAI4917557.1 hypothetical protein J4E92_008951 [Alternaria infectoria]
MAPATVSTPQKRKASLSHASASAKRTRSVSISVKVTHTATDDGPGSPDLPVVLKNPQACLGGIPEELLLKIMEHVKEVGRDDALSKLCRTDKLCKRIAEVVLYKTVHALGSSMYYKKAAAIASNHLLSEHVREIKIFFGGKKINKDACYKILANAHDIQTFHVMETYDRPAHTPKWLQILNSAVARPVGGHLNRFAKLKELNIGSRNLSVEELSCVFRLPSLETLTLEDICQTTPVENWSVPESSSSIRKLRLVYAMMDISVIAQMLLTLKALHSFRYQRSIGRWEPFAAEDNPLSIWPEHSWKLLGDALRGHRHSLEAVYATDNSDKDILDVVYPNGRDVDILGSLRDFPRLKCCHVPVEAFLDPRIGGNDLSLYLPPQVGKAGAKVAPKGPDCGCGFWRSGWCG